MRQLVGGQLVNVQHVQVDDVKLELHCDGSTKELSLWQFIAVSSGSSSGCSWSRCPSSSFLSGKLLPFFETREHVQWDSTLLLLRSSSLCYVPCTFEFIFTSNSTRNRVHYIIDYNFINSHVCLSLRQIKMQLKDVYILLINQLYALRITTYWYYQETIFC